MNQQDVLVFGGLGNPNSSVVRLYEGLLNQLRDKFSLVVIDPLVAKISSEDPGSYYNFPYSEQYPSFSAYLSQSQNRSIACVMVLTPVRSHLSILEEFHRALKQCRALFVIEKPSFSLDEIDTGFNDVVPQLKRKGATFYFIDTVIVSPVFDYFFSTEIYKSMGLPEKIVAISTDNPMAIHPDLDEYRFENRIDYLNERRLLNLDVSGGGGFGFDMGIHAIAGLVRYLQKMDLLSSKIELNEVRAECLNNRNLQRSTGAETHIFASGKIITPGAECELSIDAGKASDIWDRRLELHYSECTLVLGFGTLKHPPYIWRSDENNCIPVTFDVTDSGYSRHFNDILSSLDFDVKTIISNEDSEALMARAMLLLSQIFSVFGRTHLKREQQLSCVAQHTSTMGTVEERAIRLKLMEVLDRLALAIDE